MTLIFFTPCSRQSAIAKVSHLIVNSLRLKGVAVFVVNTEIADNDYDCYNFDGPVVSWRDDVSVTTLINESNVLVYQIGNNFRFHAGALHWLAKHAGIVCLHDFFLGHLFWGWAANRRIEANEVLRYFYGSDVANSYFSYQDSESFLKETAHTAPMTEWIAAQATSVVVHSSWGVARVLDSCCGPVRLVPLPYLEPKSENLTIKDQYKRKFKYRLITVGNINPNKRVDVVIKAIGSDPFLKEQCDYIICGSISGAMRDCYCDLANSMGVNLLVVGTVNEGDLRLLIDSSDIACCLRNPNLEAASASAIEAMLLAKILIVEDLGFYSELPVDYVNKIRPSRELDDLYAMLMDIFKNITSYRERAMLGMEWARSTFSVEVYSDEIIDIAERSMKDRFLEDMCNWVVEVHEKWSSTEFTALSETIKVLEFFES